MQNSSELTLFTGQVLLKAGTVPSNAVLRAAAEFEAAGQTGIRHVASCIERAGKIARADATEAPLYAPSRREPRPRTSTKPAAVSRRLGANARLVAEPAVIEVRRRLFESADAPFSSLLDAAKWIEAQPGHSVLTPQAQAMRSEVMRLGRQLYDLTGGASTVSIEEKTDLLAYLKPPERWVFVRPVGDPGSALDILREAVEQITKATGLSDFAVVARILAGAEPTLPVVSLEISHHGGVPLGDRHVTRVVANIEVRTPDVTFAEWKALRARLRNLWARSHRSSLLSVAETSILQIVERLGGLPAPDQIKGPARPPTVRKFWERVAKKSRVESWRAAMMKWRRARAKIAS